MAIPQTPNRTLGRTIGVVAAFFIAGVFAVGLLLGNLPSFNLGLPAFIVGEPFEAVGLIVVDDLQELPGLTTVAMV